MKKELQVEYLSGLMAALTFVWRHDEHVCAMDIVNGHSSINELEEYANEYGNDDEIDTVTWLKTGKKQQD